MNQISPTQQQIAKARELWNIFGLEAQDMSFEEFVKELNALSDPAKMHEDLTVIQMLKAREDNARLKIDRALNGN